MTRERINRNYCIYAAVAILLPLILYPMKLGNYYLHVVIMMGIFTILTSGLNLLMGYTGQVSIGHAAFFGIGAYTSALLATKLNISFWLALPLGGCAGAMAGALIGYPALRLRGISMGIVTFAMGELVRLVFVNWKSLTRGLDGVVEIPPPALWGLDFTQKLPYGYLVIGMTLFTLFLIDRIVRSRVGKAFTAIREDEFLAASTGIKVMQFKILSFALSTFLAGLAGSLYAHYMRFINPGDFTISTSMMMIAMAVIGGLGRIPGPIIGAAVMLVLPEVLRPVKEYFFLIFGIILFVAIIYAPLGFMGGISSLSKRISARHPRRHERGQNNDAV
jgi:branched-chain amino acid transport system permease protein